MRAWGQLKRGFEVLALPQWVKCVLRAWGQLKRGFEVLWVKCVLRAWGQLKRGFEVKCVLAWGQLGEMCFEGMGAVEKGV